jgi:predicted O-methyltransferase YrrM
MRTSAVTLASELWDEELTLLKSLLSEVSPDGAVLEVGTAAGGTLREMMSCFPKEARPRFVVVDPMGYFPDQLGIVRRNLTGHGLDPDGVSFRVTTSALALRDALRSQERFDFMLIDGAHKIRYVTEDLGWLQLLKPGGRVCFHDYNERHKGVTWPVDRFLARHQNYRRHRLVASLLVVEKTAESSGPETGWMDTLWANLCSPWLQLQLSLAKRLRRRPCTTR